MPRAQNAPYVFASHLKERVLMNTVAFGEPDDFSAKLRMS